MKPHILLGLPMAVAACAGAPDLVPDGTIAQAADSQLQIRHVHDLALLNDYTARSVTDPADWRKLNDQQSPATEGDS